MRIAMVSEHASPLAALGGADAGGQNVHVAALAQAVARRGAEVVVHTRRDDPHLPERLQMAPGVIVHHVDAGPPRPVPKDALLEYMPAFGAELARAWSAAVPDVVHAHFWMSGHAALLAAREVSVPVVALATTEAPDAVPAAAGVLSTRIDRLAEGARDLLADPERARVAGLAARAAALERFGLRRFLDDWDGLLEEVVST